jgi:hypothetical protein
MMRCGSICSSSRKLQLTLAVVMAAVKALEQQAAEQDEDIALVLKRHVGDALSRELEKHAELGTMPKGEASRLIWPSRVILHSA